MIIDKPAKSLKYHAPSAGYHIKIEHLILKYQVFSQNMVVCCLTQCNVHHYMITICTQCSALYTVHVPVYPEIKYPGCVLDISSVPPSRINPYSTVWLYMYTAVYS